MRSPVAGKARVHELAKELGVESKVVLAKLKEMGEFVKSASSTVEAPVARKLKEAFPAGGPPARAWATPRTASAPARPGCRRVRRRVPAAPAARSVPAARVGRRVPACRPAQVAAVVPDPAVRGPTRA